MLGKEEKRATEANTDFQEEQVVNYAYKREDDHVSVN